MSAPTTEVELPSPITWLWSSIRQWIFCGRRSDTTHPRASHAFELEPLRTPNEIRLVFIKKTSFSGDLGYHLIHAGIDSEFTAVSYTWGDKHHSRWIRCGEKLVRATRNCEDLLQALADADIPGPFWIDALCLDMGNVAERNEQVARISDIFVKASRTVVYVGPHDEHSVNVVQTIGNPNENGTVATMELGPAQEEHARQFLRRPWFSRLWAFQEFLFSRGPRVLVGRAQFGDVTIEPSMIDLQELAIMATSLRMVSEPNILTAQWKLGLQSMSSRRWRSLAEWQNGVGSCTLFNNQDPHSSLLSLKAPTRPHMEFYRLHELLQATRDLQCADPRDRLFAMIPLFKKPVSRFISPDYSKTVLQVYTDLMWFLIRYDIPEALYSTCPVCIDSSLPSWVIDWRQPPRDRPMKRADWCAGWTGSTKQMLSARYGNVLMLRGVRIGDVAAVGSKARVASPGERSSISDASQQISIWKAEWQTISRNLRDIRYTMQQIETEEATLRTDPIASPGKSGGGSVTSEIESFLDGFEPSFLGSDQLPHPCVNRRPVILDSGAPGLGPADAIASDTVCVILGVSTPLVLRPVGSKYYIVGQCLVEGYMHGEAVKTVDWATIAEPEARMPLMDFYIH